MLSFALANDETSDLSSIFVSPLDVSETSVTEGVEAARDGVDEGCGVIAARVKSVDVDWDVDSVNRGVVGARVDSVFAMATK